jgi:hypothetical protein
MSGVSPDEGTVRRILEGALRAPSAHNAQPWRLSDLGGNRYLIWYAYADKLLADPDDRDGLLAMGGFFETLRLCAQREGFDALLDFKVERHGAGINLGTVSLAALDGPPDPLAAAIDKRRCNRFPYERGPLPAGLAADLEAQGNILLPARSVEGLVARASVMSWQDRRFVTDVGEWTRFDDSSPDGMTFECLRVSRWDAFWLRVALRLGRLPWWLARIYAQRDVWLTRNSGAMCVLTVDSRTEEELFDCGRRLIRSWTLLNASGYAWHPMSVLIDQPTVDALRRMIAGRDPVAIYRAGFTPQLAAVSKRRALDRVLAATR